MASTFVSQYLRYPLIIIVYFGIPYFIQNDMPFVAPVLQQIIHHIIQAYLCNQEQDMY